MLPDVTPDIVSEDIFQAANAEIDKPKVTTGRPKHEYLLTGYVKCGYCGSPLVGSCLNHKYRYYHCRGTYPTSVKPAICKARYVKADNIEDIVWGKVREVIEHPDVILAEMNRRSSSEGNHNGHTVTKQIASLKKKIQGYENQEKRLVKLFGLGQIAEDIILDEINQLKTNNHEDEIKLSRLINIKEQTVDIAKIESILNEFCGRVKLNLDSCDLQTKRLALDALDIQVIATDDSIDIRASVPLELITIEKKFELVGV